MKHYGLMLQKHIVPRLGELEVAEVERKHILKFQFELSDMPTVANWCVDILVKMFKVAARIRITAPRVWLSFSQAYPYAETFAQVLANLHREPLWESSR